MTPLDSQGAGVTSDNTVAEIKQHLDKQGVTYPSNARKDDLLNLANGGDIHGNA
ncbi:HeH/LEM domain-containing protein [Limosilactobacillus oris]|uniref:HeH/LEM domain-containing protein n=1 Tax=Limosilactobacillus oris TaxID=1632 RepID=UPI003890C13A